MNENGVGAIEHYMYEEHELLRPAAVECMCNLVMCEEVRTIVTASITTLEVPKEGETQVMFVCRLRRCFWERMTE